jgi:hypothetical protein
MAQVEFICFRLSSKCFELMVGVDWHSARCGRWRDAARLRRHILPVLPGMLSCTRALRVRVSGNK